MSHSVEVYTAQWLNGDERAYKGVFDHYYPKLYAAGYRMRKNSEECEELAMNVLLKIWQHKTVIQNIINLEGYLYGMLRQEISRMVRKKIFKTQELSVVEEHQFFTEVDGQFNLKELQFRYEVALSKIPAKRLEIFLLSRDQGYTYQEISQLQNISSNTVRNHIASALKLLKTELHEYSDIFPLFILIAVLKR
ncbi:sigma-70 family RNA polymerase sigma factor [Mucilaginibacter sp. PAMB04168]|uniref:RNA polymerase sigma factor n=1 Tax=Mucilaginibacter sp. PAMB04168 TaxID=3138567 RepID=UPI0031F65E25